MQLCGQGGIGVQALYHGPCQPMGNGFGRCLIKIVITEFQSGKDCYIFVALKGTTLCALLSELYFP